MKMNEAAQAACGREDYETCFDLYEIMREKFPRVIDVREREVMHVIVL